MSSLPSKLALTAALGLAMAFILSCSDTGGGNNNTPVVIRKEKVSGVSQKGPFVNGAKVRIYELGANMEKTGIFFDGETDVNGNFEIKNVTLTSPYILIEASGKYINEVKGDTGSTIILRAVADVLGRDSVNINVFTHLEYDRVLNNPASRINFNNAKKEAQKNVLKALGMSENVAESSEDLTLFGSNASDSLLLAASVLLQANRSTEDVSNLLTAISSKIKDNGTLSPSTKDELASGAEWVKEHIEVVKQNIKKLDPNAKVPKAEDIDNIVAGINSSNSSGGGGSVTDIRDGKIYKTVDIGGQIWMAENLNYKADSSKCYDNKLTYCETYGRLYDWATAMGIQSKYNVNLYDSSGSKHQGICPSGWHIPSKYDWIVLMEFINSTCFNDDDGYYVCSTAGTNLKAKSGWNYGGNGLNTYNFAALPGGFYDSEENYNFEDVGKAGVWWSSLEFNNTNAYGLSMIYEDDDAYYYYGNKSDLLSVRCLKD